MTAYKIWDALGREQRLEAVNYADAAEKVIRTGRRNLYGIENLSRRNSARFYLDRGTGPLWPISVSAAAVELAMGGFK